MQKIYKVFISLIVVCLVTFVIPFNVSAESGTYVYTEYSEFVNGNSTYYGYYVPDSIKGNLDYLFLGSSSFSDTYDFVRMTSVKKDNTIYIGLVSPVQGFANISTAFYSGGTAGLSSGSNNIDGVFYNVCYLTIGSNHPLNGSVVPLVESDMNTGSQSLIRQMLIYYTYGEGTVDPDEGIHFGSLQIGFETDIAYSGGNQNAWRQNRDTIYFDRFDTMGNDLSEYLIELQAIPFSVEDSSKSNLISKTINDYLYDTVRVGSLGYWSPGTSKIDFTWEFVTNRFSPVWWSTYGDNWSLTGWYNNNKWYRVGWSYRARLVDEENNVLIDWQTIYNGTSIDGKDVDNIINNNGLTPELVNSINNINNNNNTTNNNTYNNQVINYYNEDQEADGSWLEALLNGIFSTLGNLMDLLKGVFSGLVDLILGLFDNVNPSESFFSWFLDLFNGIGEIDLTLPQFNIPSTDLSSFNRLVQETMDIFSLNNFGFVLFIPLLLIIIKAVF